MLIKFMWFFTEFSFLLFILYYLDLPAGSVMLPRQPCSGEDHPFCRCCIRFFMFALKLGAEQLQRCATRQKKFSFPFSGGSQQMVLTVCARCSEKASESSCPAQLVPLLPTRLFMEVTRGERWGSQLLVTFQRAEGLDTEAKHILQCSEL